MSSYIPERLIDQGVDEVKFETIKYMLRFGYRDDLAPPTKAKGKQGRRKPIRTIGTLRGIEAGYIYVGQGKNGKAKVGMSGNPEHRCKGLGITLLHKTPVVGAAALDVETETLRLCGAEQGDGEWTRHPPEVVIGFVDKAMETVSKRRRVDPSLTEEEARRLRISSCAPV